MEFSVFQKKLIVICLGVHFPEKFQTIVQYPGVLQLDGKIVYDFPEKLEIKYMLHCTGGNPTFESGVIMSNLDKAELVLFEI